MSLSRKATFHHPSEQEWRQLCKEWEQTKPPQKQFCSERNLNYNHFVVWRSKILVERGESRVNKFTTVKVSPSMKPSPQSNLVLKMPNGITIHIAPDTPKQILSMTLNLLGVTSC